MNAALFAEPWVQRLGWVLLHFIWQGAIIALLLAAALRVMTRAASHTRYLVIGGALLACTIVPMVTWTMVRVSIEPTAAPVTAPLPAFVPDGGPSSKTVLDSNAPSPLTQSAEKSWQERLASAASAALPYVVAVWLCGVLILTARLTLGWSLARRLCRIGLPIRDTACMERFRRLMARMQVRVPVRLLESALVEVPTLIGWLKPTILIPASVFAGLTPDQLDAILAHELAHVRRCDYLVNLFQAVIETVLFYHPAVWWISRKLREERENCCDDIALETMQNRLVYVSALAQLEAGRAMPLALTATGGSLLQRIQRIVGANERKVSAWPLWILIAGLLTVACVAQTKATETPALTKQPELWFVAYYVDTPNPSTSPEGTKSSKEEEDSVFNDPNNTDKAGMICSRVPSEKDSFTYTIPSGDCTLRTDSLNNQALKVNLKERWLNGASGSDSSSVEFNPTLHVNDCFRITGPLKNGKTSNLFVTLVDYDPLPPAQRPNADADRSAQMLEAIKKGDAAAVQKLIDQGANLNAKQADYNYWADYYHQPKILELLQDRPAHFARLTARLKSIHVDLPAFTNTPLEDVMATLAKASVKGDPDGNGVVIDYEDAWTLKGRHTETNVTQSASTDISLYDALDAITRPIHLKFYIHENYVDIFPQSMVVGILENRTFTVPAGFFPEQSGDTVDVRQYLENRGIEFPNSPSPADKASATYFPGKSSLVARTTQDYLDKIQVLLNTTPSSAPASANTGSSAQMLEAIKNGDTAAAQKLIDQGIDLSASSDNFTSWGLRESSDNFVYWAVYYNQPEILELLLQHDAVANVLGPDYKSPLELAREKNPKLADILQAGMERNRQGHIDKLTAKLNAIHIDLPAFSNAPLADVVALLSKKAREADPTGEGISIVVTKDPATTSAKVTLPASTNLSLSDALGLITAQTKLDFIIDEDYVGIRPQPDGHKILDARTFAVPPGFFPDKSGDTVDVKPDLVKRGFTFPVGTYATYIPANGELIFRNTAGQQDMLSGMLSPKAFPNPKGSILIELKVAEIDEDVYQANRDKVDEAVKNCDIDFFVNLKGISLLSAPSVTTMPDERATIEITRPVVYPTTFEAPRTALVKTDTDSTVMALVPPTPSQFETKYVGVSADLKALPDGDKIDLTGKFTVTQLDGMTKSNMRVLELPAFTTKEMVFMESLNGHKPIALWVPGADFDEQTITDTSNGKQTTSTQVVKKRMILILDARHVK